MILQINNLTKNYKNKKALDNVSFNVEAGKVVGLLGPNGSGKTTLMNIIANLNMRYSGEVKILGESPSSLTKAMVSYLPDRSFLQPTMKVGDAFKIFSDFYSDFNIDKANLLKEKLNLHDEERVGQLSKGMVERLTLSLILSRDAKLFILDEPIAGVDQLTRKLILDTLIDMIDPNCTMLVTTHLVRDLERIFDEVIFLNEGRIILSGRTEDLIAEKKMSIESLYENIYGGLENGKTV